MEDIAIRPFEAGDISAMRAIWNEVVADGRAFPQEEPLRNDEEAKEFFESQTAAVVAVGGRAERAGREDAESFPTGEGCVGRADGEASLADGAQTASEAGEVLGLYILHPNNVGRCGHIANTSYAVSKAARGKHVGAALVTDSLHRARRAGSACCSSTPWLPPTPRRYICTISLASRAWAPSPAASAISKAFTRTSIRTTLT